MKTKKTVTLLIIFFLSGLVSTYFIGCKKIDLVRLAVQYNAAKGERTGDFTLTSVDYELERGKLLARLGGWNWA